MQLYSFCGPVLCIKCRTQCNDRLYRCVFVGLNTHLKPIYLSVCVEDLFYLLDLELLNHRINTNIFPFGIQHWAARFVVHSYSWETSGSTLASALSWSTLEQRRAEAKLCTMYKITNNLLDISPNQYLIPGHSQTR